MTGREDWFEEKKRDPEEENMSRKERKRRGEEAKTICSEGCDYNTLHKE